MCLVAAMALLGTSRLGAATGEANIPPLPAEAAAGSRDREVALVDHDAAVGPWPGAYPPHDVQFVLAYDNGFLFGTERGSLADEQFPFRFRVSSWVQLRHVGFDSDGPNPGANVFEFPRLRLAMDGHIFAPELKYFLQLDGSSDGGGTSEFLDYFVSYDFGHHLLACDRERLNVKLGRWKMPFSRSRWESGRRLQFTDRSTANVFFDLNRSIGVGLFGRLAAPVFWETAVFNGFRTGSSSTTRGAGLDQNAAWSMRVYADVLGEPLDSDEPDLSWHEVPALRIGGGLAYTRVNRVGASEFQRQRVVDSGVPLADLLPADVRAYNVAFYTIDAHWKYRGWSLIADYYWRYLSQFKADRVPSLFDHGLSLQTGYFVVPERLELLARWSRIVGDSETLGGAVQSSDEVAAGAVLYIRGHNAKLTFDATHLNGAPVRSARLDIFPGDVGWLFRTQFQLAF